jgi:nicotinate-nucleotide--dimethylbenzimidazole phosphoribosyltransferase
VGAGAPPVAGGNGARGHPRRPPIPIVAVDPAAEAAARARLTAGSDALRRLADLAGWLGAVTGSETPEVRARIVLAAADHGAEPDATAAVAGAVDAAFVLVDAGVAGGLDAADVRTGLGPSRDPRSEPALSVEEVALGVDAGRELAARAADEGVTVLAGAAAGDGVVAATCLAAALTGGDLDELAPGAGVRDACERALEHHPDAAEGPLHALRRLGAGDLAVLCGLAIGAGEHGLGYVADGLGATAAAVVAAGIEPELRPRLRVAAERPEGAHAALLAHAGLDAVLGHEPTLGPGIGAAAALAMLRVAATAASSR